MWNTLVTHILLICQILSRNNKKYIYPLDYINILIVLSIYKAIKKLLQTTPHRRWVYVEVYPLFCGALYFTTITKQQNPSTKQNLAHFQGEVAYLGRVPHFVERRGFVLSKNPSYEKTSTHCLRGDAYCSFSSVCVF